MEIEEEMRRKIVVSVGVVAVFVAAVLYVGELFDSNGLSETGGFALVGVVALFVVAMGVAGVYLDRAS